MTTTTTEPRRLGRTRVRFALGLAFGFLVLAAHAVEADEYLESDTGRSGFAIGFGLGPGLFAGGGEYGDLLGTGVDTSLRIGTSAGPRTLWILQLDSVAYLAEDEVTNPPSDSTTHTNIHSTLTLGMQYYVREVLWCKGGAGMASIAQRQQRGSKNETLSSGFGLMASCGMDFYRRHSLALDVESAFGLGIYSDGAIGQFGVKMALNWY